MIPDSILSTLPSSPCWVYDVGHILGQIGLLQSIKLDHLRVRYAMKANHHPAIMQLMLEQGIGIDASSEYEVQYAIQQGYTPSQIQLCSQQLPHNLGDMIYQNIDMVATSLHQLEEIGKYAPHRHIGIRINPGAGSGHHWKTTVAGTASSFGIRHTYIPEILAIAKRYDLTITKLHTHIGSGIDPKAREAVVATSLQLCLQFPDITTINLGGGRPVARMPGESLFDTDHMTQLLQSQSKVWNLTHTSPVHREIELGGRLVANSGYLVAHIIDIVDTGHDGYTFIKLNTGMNDILRPTLYGSQHPITVYTTATTRQAYVFVGHCCESGDILTVGSDGHISPIITSTATIGDQVIIGGCGAYCQSMSAVGYNGYPPTPSISYR